MSEEGIRKSLKIAVDGLNIGKDIADSSNTLELVTAVQQHLSTIKAVDSSRWAQTSAFIAKLIAKAHAPEGTKASVIELLMETFYQVYIKRT